MTKWLWRIMLGYIFLRPFVPEVDCRILALTLNSIFLISGCIYILKKPSKFAFIDKLILVFLSGLLVSTVFSNNFLNSLIELYKYLPLILIFYAMRTIDKENEKQLIFMLIISATLVSFYSLHFLFTIQRFAADHPLDKLNYVLPQDYLSRKRAFFPFVSPNLLANYLTMIIMFCLGLTIQKMKENKKGLLFFLNLFCLCISFLALFSTRSIGGWLVLTFSVSIFFILGKMRGKKTMFIISLIFICFVVVWAMRMHGDKHFIKPSFSVHQRISYWKETISIIRKHPLTGVGIGNFSLQETRTAHNSYLQIWAEMGMLGIISWLGIIFLFIKKGVKNLHFKEASYYRLGILLSGVSFIGHNLIDFSFFVPEVAFLWWIMLGLIYI